MTRERDPALFSRPTPSRRIDEPYDVRIETTVTESMGEDIIVAYKTARCRSKQEWLRELIVKELYGVQGVQRLRDGLPPNQPEDFR